MRSSILSILFTSLLPATLVTAQANGTIVEGSLPDDLNGSNFTYPWPVKLFKFMGQQQELEMAFMDVQPQCNPNGKTAVLFHGKNFCGPTWETTIRTLISAGYRVVAPDQVGFCKSSKPSSYQFGLSQLAWNSRGLLNALDVANVTVIGHSMGGMLTTRFGLQYPDSVDEMVIVNAIGLEDYVKKGVPYASIDDTIASESASSYESIKAYEKTTYYVDEWRDDYDTWVKMLTNVYHGSERDRYVKNQAQIVDMVLTQPVADKFRDLKPRTLLMVGEKDNTAIGAQWSPPEVAKKLGHFDILGPRVVDEMQDGHLVAFPELGHAPQISHPEEFHEALLAWLSD